MPEAKQSTQHLEIKYFLTKKMNGAPYGITTKICRLDIFYPCPARQAGYFLPNQESPGNNKTPGCCPGLIFITGTNEEQQLLVS